jgi:AraC-like DNA-binding protein
MPPVAAAQLEESDMPSGGIREERLTVRPELRSYVASMSFVEARGVRRVFLPDAFARILVVRDASGPSFHAYLVGPRSGTIRKEPARQEAIMLRLSAGAVPALMSIAASEISGTIVTLDSVWGRPVRPWLDRLAEAKDRSRRHAIVEEELLTRVRAASRSASSTRLLASFDLDDGARVATAADRLGMSERHLRRVFHEAVGLAPKAFVRVARLRRALGLARQQAPASWTRIAAEAGYFDQAHMVAEFRDLTGRSPTALRRELEDP